MAPRRETLRSSHRFGGRLGFRIEERMEGTHRLLRDLDGAAVEVARRAGVEAPFSFVARWGHPRLSAFLNPLSGDFLSAAIEGEVSAGGICEAAPFVGNLELEYLGRQAITYTFDFDAGGRRLRFHGEKRHIRPWNLPWSHTTCYGELAELASGEPLSTVLVRFPLTTLFPFISSFRLT